MPKTIWIMRHAENHKDESLGLAATEEGIRKAHLLGERIAAADKNAPALIVSTSSLRGTQTAAALKTEFEKQSKETYAVQNDRVGSEDLADTVHLITMIAGMEQSCAQSGLPVPESLVLITHKQNDLMLLFNSILDPAASIRGHSLPEDADMTQEHFEKLAASLNNDDLMAHFGGKDSELVVPDYLDALHFDMRVGQWADFRWNCAQFRQKLDIS